MGVICPSLTTDKLIRTAFKENLRNIHESDPTASIIEELGIRHGSARIDIAVVNGVIHGYELKSDADTLSRLPEQMKEYNAVFDHITLVVGREHLHKAIQIIPDWWGVILAKLVPASTISFCTIREAEDNPQKNNIAAARLLWRDEALDILEAINQAEGVRSKTRQIIYERLADALDEGTLRRKIRERLSARANWRSVIQHTLDGG